MSQGKRSYLFLQGVCSPFFARLADSITLAGHQVTKINFNGGDVTYWRRQSALAFRMRIEEFPAFLEQKICDAGVTDMVLFGDRRPLHRLAIEQVQKKGIKIHVFEEGYFRPYWVTLERGGVNAHSRLPRDPLWYSQTGRTLKNLKPVESFKSSLRVRAVHDILYHAAGMLNPLFFPGYRSHAPVVAPVMYAGYLKRFALKPLYERRDQEIISSLIAAKIPFYFLPLQLNSDAQIRDHSRFEHMAEVMAFVMQSFASHAPSHSRLVIKNHPLDMGLSNYPRIIRKLEQHFDVAGRVDYLETGSLEALVLHALGTVTVNSTVGGVALQCNCPTIALGDPIYNIEGLTFPGELDQFWQNASPPDFELFSCFRQTVIQATQVNGGFYSDSGVDLAVKNAVVRLTADRSPLEELL